MAFVVASKDNYLNGGRIRKIAFNKAILCNNEYFVEVCHVITWENGCIDLISGDEPNEDGMIDLFTFSSEPSVELYTPDECLNWEGSPYKVIRDKNLYDRISALKPIPVYPV